MTSSITRAAIESIWLTGRRGFSEFLCVREDVIDKTSNSGEGLVGRGGYPT